MGRLQIRRSRLLCLSVSISEMSGSSALLLLLLLLLEVEEEGNFASAQIALQLFSGGIEMVQAGRGRLSARACVQNGVTFETAFDVTPHRRGVRVWSAGRWDSCTKLVGISQHFSASVGIGRALRRAGAVPAGNERGIMMPE